MSLEKDKTEAKGRDWQSTIPVAPGLYLWREKHGDYEHNVEIFYEKISSGQIGRLMRCYSVTDFEPMEKQGEWSYIGSNLVPKVSPSDISFFAGAEGWSNNYPSGTGGFLWRQNLGQPACRVDIHDATLLSGERDRVVISYNHSAAEEFAMLSTQGEWARPDSLKDYVG